MLARDYSYDPVSVCLSQSVSLTSRRSVETSGRIELGFFWYGGLLQPIVHCVNSRL